MANLKYRASSTEANPVSTTVKGTPLTNIEVDANFKSLNDDLALKATTSALTTAQSDAQAEALSLSFTLG